MEQRCSSVINSEASVSGTLNNLCVKSQHNRLLLMNKDLSDHPYWKMQDDVALPQLKDQIVLYFVLSVDGVINSLYIPFGLCFLIHQLDTGYAIEICW